MQRLCLIAAVMLMSLPASLVLAQTTPDTGAGTTTTAPAAAAPATTTTPPAAAAETTKAEPAKPKKKAAKKMTRQQEIDRSIDSGTVPSRYRSRVPKEYHQYIPFDKK